MSSTPQAATLKEAAIFIGPILSKISQINFDALTFPWSSIRRQTAHQE
jgi:hypothetical protein